MFCCLLFETRGLESNESTDGWMDRSMDVVKREGERGKKCLKTKTICVLASVLALCQKCMEHFGVL